MLRAELASLAREHNNAQVVSIGGRFTATEVAKEIVDAFVATAFSGDARHVRRIDMVTAYEDDGTLPPSPPPPRRGSAAQRMRGSPVWGKMPTLRLAAT